MHQKFNSWSSCYLLQGGKEVFIESILQALLNYSMACFLLPKSLYFELEGICVKYWWGKGPGKKGMHWREWKYLCVPKESGGLGLLTKQD